MQKSKSPLATLVIVVVIVICAGAAYLALGPKADQNTATKDTETTAADGKDVQLSMSDYKSMSDVNTVIKNSNYFEMEFPQLTCGPSDQLYTQNYKSWTQQWVKCLETTWEPVVTAGDTKYYALAETEYPKTAADIWGCKNPTERAAAAYCAATGAISIVESNRSGSIERDLSTLFHEFSHHLQMNFGVNTDAKILTSFVYNNAPDQPISKEAALKLQQSRIEINAVCSELGMMNMAKRTGSPQGSEWLQSYSNPPAHFVEAGYGTGAMLNRFISDMTSSSPRMSSCNTWLWTDQDLQP